MIRRQPERFSLVVATYGRSTALGPLVASLMAQTWRDFDVIVVDQNADDRVAPIIAPLRDAGLLGGHLRMRRPSASGARNLGLAEARGEIVAFPDDDCWYEPDTLAKAAAHFDGDRGLAGVAGRWVEAGRMPGDDKAEIDNEAMRHFRAGNLACITLFLRRERVVGVGGFDERIGPGKWFAGAEETDLVMSLLAAGGRLRRAGDVLVHHPPDDGARSGPKRHPLQTIRARARGTGALYAKHRLPAWVIGRGLLGPIAAVPEAGIAISAARMLGRIEGLVGWHLGDLKGHVVHPAGGVRNGGQP
ncbi:MAG: glycosyltransferase family A protein [Hyphomicrobiaceae bacterium]|nr:glycosyltransferase family A protein [Hyphomicrobiaceae bacterium]